VTHLDLGSALTRSMLSSTRDRTFLSALLAFTVAVRPPRGLVGDLTVAHTGRHRGQLDLKRVGLRPVVLLGRWMALATSEPGGSTVDRIRRGAHAGLLTSGEAEDLVGAFEQIYQLCFDQEIAALRTGGTSDSFVAPREIDPLRRRYLHDSLRAVSQIQTAVRRSWTSGRTVRPGLA
jgi:CBS domain-containing protein